MNVAPKLAFKEPVYSHILMLCTRDQMQWVFQKEQVVLKSVTVLFLALAEEIEKQRSGEIC